MNKRAGRKLNVEIVKDIPEEYNITKKEFILDSEQYEKENYNPLDGVIEDELNISENASEEVTMHLTPIENRLLKHLASANGMSRDKLLRRLITLGLESCKDKDYHIKLK